jgi:hypothetical protein
MKIRGAFCYSAMTAYLATVLGIALTAFAVGWRLARSQQNRRGELPPETAVALIGLGLAWFIIARLARTYADTDGLGAEVADWFAHSGKWLVLLGGMVFGHGWICGGKQIPPAGMRRILYFIPVLGIVALMVARTVPVYFLLGHGRRDADGLVRQSEQVETTCGAVALLNYLEQYRQHAPLTEREVARVCGVTAEGTTTRALVNTAHQFGLTNATARVLTLAEIEKSRLPVIVSISTLPTVHHATLLVSLDAERVNFIDPAYGKWSVPRARFLEIWYGKTVLLEP